MYSYRTRSNSQAVQPLTLDQLQSKGLDLENKYSDTLNFATNLNSERYKVIKTIDVVNAFKAHGYFVTSISKARKLNAEKSNSALHLVKLSHSTFLRPNGDRIEVLLKNSHDASRSFEISLGIYRLVCSNGLMVGTQFFQRSIKHVGSIQDQIDKLIPVVITQAPKILALIDKLDSVQVDHLDKLRFAQRVCENLIEHGLDKIQFNLNELVCPTRTLDQAPTLWTVLNVVQEKLLRGGVQYSGLKLIKTPDQPDRLERVTKRSRVIKSIQRTIDVNREIMDIAVDFAA